ncbi:MAG: hypothetical protein GXO04_04425 [Aquificae bacterium]|nr:hypothetical protein [Aquificota bacterium]
MVLLFCAGAVLVALLQASLFSPLFGSLFLTPSLSFIFVLVSSYFIKEKAIVSAFLSGLFLDTITDTLGVLTLLNVVFTYLFLFLTGVVLVRNKFLEFFVLIPFISWVRKLILILLVRGRFMLEFSLELFLLSALVELVFIFILYKSLSGRIDEKT